MQVEIIRAEEPHALLLANVYQLYLYDYTDFMDWDVDEHGCFAHSDLDTLFTDPTRHGFLLKIDGALAGFALIRAFDHPIRKEAAFSINMDEFFVLRKYRRIGVGRLFAVTCFNRFPGRWRVSQLPGNRAAIAFWRNVIGGYSAEPYHELTAEDGDNVIFFHAAVRM